jgi:hypothetical protein
LSRHYQNWIEAFCLETESTSSPLIFRRWAAIMAVSGALERKVYTWSRRSRLYPNLYVMLIGPPAVGKTAAIDVVRHIWRQNKDIKVAASNISSAALIDELKDSFRSIVRPQELEPTLSFNSLAIASNELQVFLKAYESDFIGLLTEIYDCKDNFEERKRKFDDRIKIEHPSLTFLAGTTPSFLGDLLADGAWDQGFSSRTIFIYSGEEKKGDIFIDGLDEEIYSDLIHDLREINKITGKYVWDQDAATALTEWYKRGGPPEPTHPKLQHYRGRRHVHIIKLAMCATAAESDEMVIRLHHYQQALDWLLEAEAFMPDIFRATMGSDRKIMDEAWHYAFTVYTKEGMKPLPKMKMIEFISQRAPVHSVDRILAMMVGSGAVKERLEKHGLCYEPLPRG